MNSLFTQPLIVQLTILSFVLSGSAFAATHHDVNISNFQYTPSSVAVADGDTVIWHWTGGTHSTTSNVGVTPSWNSPQQTSGTFTVVFPASAGNGPWPYHCSFHGLGMAGTITRATLGVDVIQDNALPAKFALSQNYPNPFNPSTTIRFSIDKSSDVEFTVYNVLGQTVDHKELGLRPAGNYNLTWNGTNSSGATLPSGIYFYRLKAGELTDTRKMVLLK